MNGVMGFEQRVASSDCLNPKNCSCSALGPVDVAEKGNDESTID